MSISFNGGWEGSVGAVDGVELATRLNAMMTQYDTALNSLWVMVAAVLVFWMQGGFAMLEVGSVRSKNAQNILLKNLFDICVGAFFWFGCGHGLASGTTIGGFMGSTGFFGSGFDTNQSEYLNWFFGWTFAATAATIVSGALAERTMFEGYAIFSMIMSAFIYPVGVHWAWSGDGWLGGLGFHDFAGSGVVHAVAGVSALAGASIVGARTNRFAPDHEHKFRPHNVPLVMIGTVILWMGWYGFNCGTTAALSTEADAYAVGRIAMVTTLASAVGGMTAFLVRYMTSGVYDVSAMCNGVLAGLVGITAACDACGPWSSVLCGAGGGLALISASGLLRKMEIDDPLDAFAVHGAAGIWGVLAVGLVHEEKGVLNGGGLNLLGIQLGGILALLAWSGGLSTIVFVGLKSIGKLRVTQETEDAGLDIHEHGGRAYFFRGMSLANDKAVELTGGMAGIS